MRNSSLFTLTEQKKPFLILGLVALAAISAASYPFLAKFCTQCSLATEYLLPHADKVGLIYYVLLAALIARFKLNSFTKGGLFLAAGVHAALIAKLLSLHLFCGPCVACAAFIGSASLVVMDRGSRFVTACALAGVIFVGASSFVYQKVQLAQEDQRVKKAIHYEQLQLQANKSVPIYVYEDPNCYSCREFMDLYVPRLTKKYGDKIELHVQSGAGQIPTPTIVVGGSAPKMFVHKPEWFALTKVIEQNSVAKNAAIAEFGNGRL